MTFPNGFQGVKKLFSSEILKLIAGFLMLVGTILIAVAAAAVVAGSGTGLAVSGIGLIVAYLAAAVLSVIGYIFKLIGLKRAGHDDESFNKAFWIAICALVLSVLNAIFSAFNVGGGIADNIVQLFVNLSDIFITIFVIGGIQSFAAQLNKDEMVNKGTRLLTIIVIMYVIAMIATLVPVFFGSNPESAGFSGILGIVAAVFNIVAYIIFLIYLGQAKKMLAEN